MISFSIYIDALEDGDDIAIIQPGVNDLVSLYEASQINNNMGVYIDVTKVTLNNSILDLTKTSTIELTFNSNADWLISQGIEFPNSGDDTVWRRLLRFVHTLAGRRVIVQVQPEDTERWTTVYDGFVAVQPSEVSVQGGTNFTLVCKTKLAQLATMSANGSWNDSTRTFNSVFLSISENTIKKHDLFVTMLKGTLLEGEEFVFLDGDLPPLPDEIWCLIPPNKARLDVIREALIPYSRIVYQLPTGQIMVSGLFYEGNEAPTWFNVNATDNSAGTWIELNATNNAPSLPNRIDVIFGLSNIASLYGNDQFDFQNSNVFASSPITKDGKIVSNSSMGLDYTEVYKTSTRLYNSGRWVMPHQESVSLGDITQNPVLTNIISYKGYGSSEVHNPAQDVFGSGNFAKLYALIYLAEINSQNYNATVVYDYSDLNARVIDEKLLDPEARVLGTVVTIDNYDVIDYKNMLVCNTTLIIAPSVGSNIILDMCPLLSITPVWGRLS